MNKCMYLGRIAKATEAKTYGDKGGKNATIFLEVNDQRWDREAQAMVPVKITLSLETYDSKNRKNATTAEGLAIGSMVYLEGRTQIDTWKDQNSGQPRSRQKVVIDLIEPLDAQEAPKDSYGDRF